MEPDEMEELPRGRRWRDVEDAIDVTVRKEAAIAVRQEMTPFRLTLDRVDQEIRQVRTTLYGDPATHARGLVEQFDKIQSQLNTIIDQNEARLNQWKGIKTALVIVGAISSVPALQTFGKLFGLIP